jgi:hypothetical protein
MTAEVRIRLLGNGRYGDFDIAGAVIIYQDPAA